MTADASNRAGVALLIGVGDYLHADRIARLPFAARDAKALARLFVDADVCGFPRGQVVVLTDRRARREAIVDRLSGWLPARARGAEIVVIYFAGHGTVQEVGGKEEGFLLPHDASPDNALTRGVAMSDLARWVQGIEAGGVLVCLDCCHAGKIIPRGPVADRSPGRDLVIWPALLQGITGKGRFLIASCDEGQKSLEAAELRHGLFTYHLLKGISGAADRDGDGKVGVAELFNYVSTAVSRDAREKFGREQTPWTNSTWTSEAYVSAPRAPRKPPAELASIRRLEREAGRAAAVREIEQRLGTADDDLQAAMLQLLRAWQEPAGIPVIFQCLAHRAAAVREQARQAVAAIGWDKTAAAIEELARRGDAARMGAVLDGLMAFEAHAEVVGLLDRLIVCLKGDLRNRAIALLERKRLSLGLDRVTALFQEKQSSYEIQKVLGAGLLTAAYLARDQEAELEVVVRVLRPEFAGHPEVRTRFLDLNRRAVRFVHQNLVLTRETKAFPERDIYYTVRDYVPGATLREVVEAGQRFDPEQVLKILRQVAAALTPLHREPCPHGGVKPSNIFLRTDNQVILGDPSLPVAATSLDLKRLSYDFRYAPPELFRSGGVLGPASDFYALGCVAYELLCGQPPFVSDNHFELAGQHDRSPVVPPTSRGSALGVAGDRFLERLLAKSPADRFGSLDEFFEALDALHAELRGGLKPMPSRRLLDREALARYQLGQSIISLPFATGGQRPDAGPPEARPESAEPTGYKTLPGAGPGESVPCDEEVTAGQSPPALREGLDIGNGYRLVKRLGTGGFGEVWRATSHGGILVAVKIGFRTLDHEEAQRELQALELIRELRHPYLLPTHAFWTYHGRLHIAMELADGSLRDRLKQCREQGLTGIPVPELLKYFAEAAEALDWLHARSVLHRDIKPDNILLLQGHAKVGDFGLARELTAGHSQTASHSGTPAYMAPEMWGGKVSQHTDQYCLAAAYAELRLDRRLFPGRDLFELMTQHISTAPNLDPLPVAEQAVLLRALAKKPEERYVSCAAFAEALQQALVQGPGPLGSPEPAQAPAEGPGPEPSLASPPPASLIPHTPDSPVQVGEGNPMDLTSFERGKQSLGARAWRSLKRLARWLGLGSTGGTEPTSRSRS
jgi:serine/threonine protein kinase/uncharacterized caspase-like protein